MTIIFERNEFPFVPVPSKKLQFDGLLPTVEILAASRTIIVQSKAPRLISYEDLSCDRGSTKLIHSCRLLHPTCRLPMSKDAHPTNGDKSAHDCRNNLHVIEMALMLLESEVSSPKGIRVLEMLATEVSKANSNLERLIAVKSQNSESK